MKEPCVYMLASRAYGTLYVGVTSDLVGRMERHRRKDVPSFTANHDVGMLVWYETHETMESAIVREKQLKKWKRAWKVRLIEKANPAWVDLTPTLL